MKANFVITCGLGMAGIVGATYEYDDEKKMQYMDLVDIQSTLVTGPIKWGLRVQLAPVYNQIISHVQRMMGDLPASMFRPPSAYMMVFPSTRESERKDLKRNLMNKRYKIIADDLSPIFAPSNTIDDASMADHFLHSNHILHDLIFNHDAASPDLCRRFQWQGVGQKSLQSNVANSIPTSRSRIAKNSSSNHHRVHLKNTKPCASDGDDDYVHELTHYTAKSKDESETFNCWPISGSAVDLLAKSKKLIRDYLDGRLDLGVFITSEGGTYTLAWLNDTPKLYIGAMHSSHSSSTDQHEQDFISEDMFKAVDIQFGYDIYPGQKVKVRLDAAVFKIPAEIYAEFISMLQKHGITYIRDDLGGGCLNWIDGVDERTLILKFKNGATISINLYTKRSDQSRAIPSSPSFNGEWLLGRFFLRGRSVVNDATKLQKRYKFLPMDLSANRLTMKHIS
uniref:Uncharacterized protein AlNc14C90G5642 n=1 Tax=Albugo laibachii Nc14 TaxID=890382 RepID=F0WGB2_9STRA|nr:sporangia induced conserved hypothetical protein [Albugo laibachii Nc14]|eukprot:CCA20258.1 sporangia induced conserved hypothetical protein [Albugo laibachii Nc14]